MPDQDTKSMAAALRVRATTRLSTHRKPAFAGTSAHVLALLAHEDTLCTTMLVTPETSRVDTGATSVVHHRGTMTLLDHKLRCWTELSARRMRILPPHQLRMTTSERGKLIDAHLELHDVELGHVRSTLTFSRDPKLAPYGAALLRLVYCGTKCHAVSRLPHEELAKLGCLVEARSWLGADPEPASMLSLELELVPFAASDFVPPAGYRHHRELKPAPYAARPVEADEEDAGAPDTAPAVQPFATAIRVPEPITPDCLGSTRRAPVAATVHQDLLDHAASLANTVAPFVGTATFGEGLATLPWLSAITSLVRVGGPGSGMSVLLREPRRTTARGGPDGGRGLLDRLAWRDLTTPVRDGLTATELAFRDSPSALRIVLEGLGVGEPTILRVLAAGGNLELANIDAAIEVVEAYETRRGTFEMPVPTSVGPIETAGLVTTSLSNIAGAVSFASLGTLPLVRRARIGAGGTVELNLRIPDVSFTARADHSLTAAGHAAVAAATLGGCIFMPQLCPLTLLVGLTLEVMLHNFVDLTARSASVRPDYVITYAWDDSAGRVQPTVALVARSGRVDVTTTAVSFNVVGSLFDAMVASVGGLFGVWLEQMCEEIRARLEAGLRERTSFPAADQRAGRGSADSVRGALLTLSAELTSEHATQVETRAVTERRLLEVHARMRRDLNPQPATPPPLGRPVITVGSYAGLALSQNAIDVRLAQLWRAGSFERTVTDPVEVAALVDRLPQSLFVGRRPNRVHMWLGAPPRAQVALPELVAGARPLVAYLDDVRVCFELVDGKGKQLARWELSFAASTPATIDLALPFGFDVRLDSAATIDARTWELVDPQGPAAMATAIAGVDLAGLGLATVRHLIAELRADEIVRPEQVRAWGRPLVATQQTLVLPEAGAESAGTYLEVLGHRRTLYALVGLDAPLALELVDGSGAPALNALLGLLGVVNPAVPIASLATLTTTQGLAVLPVITGSLPGTLFPPR